MVSTSKILTVSYGTFSCTLEGFDDSFETMKAIAEYFRDLAADDRYFGAEPPTPDAEMLARIAEREISRRVQAHEDQGKIHLRAEDSSGAAEALTHAALVASPAAQDAAPAPVSAPEAKRAESATETEASKSDPSEAEETPVEAIASDDVEVESADTETEIEQNADAADAALEQLDTDDSADIDDNATEDEAADEVDASEDRVDMPEDEDAEVSGQEAETDAPEAAEAEPAMAEAEEATASREDDTPPEDLEESAAAPSQEHAYPDLAAFIADAEADEAEAAEAQKAAEESDAEQAVETEVEIDDAEAALEDEFAEEETLSEVDTEAVAAEDEALAEAEAEDDVAEAEGEHEAPAAPAHAAATSDPSDSVAEKLRRIRSVVSQSDLDYEVSEYSEDEHALDMGGGGSDELDALLSEDLEDEEDAPGAIVEEDVADAEDEDTLDALMAGLDEPETPAAAPVAKDALAEDPSEEETAEAASAAPVMVDQDTLSQLLADATPVQEPVETARGVEAEDLVSDDADEDEMLDAEPEEAGAAAPFVLGKESRVADAAEDQTVRPLNARVLKMKRSEFEDAVAQGLIEEDSDDEFEADDDSALLSPEEEADLQRELAEVEAEFEDHEIEDFDGEMDGEDDAVETPEAAEIDEDEIEDAEFAEVEPVADDERDEDDDLEDAAEAPERDIAARGAEDAAGEDTKQADAPAEEKPRRGLSRFLGMGKSAPEDEERIFEEADSQMGDKDASMRRTAIQHLRAAVAATKAEKSAGVDIDQSVDETPYRSDLAEVVRPRRPSSAPPTTRSVRPNEQKPAPLKLVAEQRVDTERAPVRPRRVSTMTVPEVPQSDSGFTAFAKEMGATNLSDLLEAAAAYMSDVEGHAEFTRPMLMGKLKEVKSDSYSREDGLRSFGQLLRQGKLRKLKGGRFAATEETEFRAEARNAS